jgi:hypothetical protein
MELGAFCSGQQSGDRRSLAEPPPFSVFPFPFVMVPPRINHLVLRTAMYSKTAAFCFALSLSLMGCTSSAPPPAKEETAAQTKAIVDEFVQKAKQAPEAAPADLAVLLESLDARAQDSGPAYASLRDTAKELQAMYQRSASKEEISGQLDKLSQAAAGL